MFFDPLYLLFMLPGMALAIWAQARIMSAYHEGSRIPASSGVTGAEAAHIVMQSAGMGGVAIEPVAGQLTDHYDPTHKVLRLSEGNYAGHSLAALGVAAHEAGHAIQDARHYAPLMARNLIVPLAGFGSNISYLLLMLGFVFHAFALIVAGIVLFSTVVVFQLVNLPVEFDASRRARQALMETGLINSREAETVRKVLNAAAWTYVAATITSALQLLYFLYRSGLLGGRSQD